MDRTHWNGCLRHHTDCAVARIVQLERELAAAQARIAELEMALITEQEVNELHEKDAARDRLCFCQK